MGVDGLTSLVLHAKKCERTDLLTNGLISSNLPLKCLVDRSFQDNILHTMFFFNFLPPCGCGSHVTFWGVFGIWSMTGGHLFSKKYLNEGFIWTILRALHFCELWCFSSTLCLHVTALGTAMYHVTLWGELAVCSDERSPNLWEVFIQTLIILREETIGQMCFEKNAMFFFNFVFSWGAVGTIPCDALRAWGLVWQDVHLSQKSVQTEFMWFSCFTRLCTMWDSGDRLGYGLTRFIFVKENLGYGLKGCRMMSPNLKVLEVKLIWVIFVFIHQPRISNYNHLYRGVLSTSFLACLAESWCILSPQVSPERGQ